MHRAGGLLGGASPNHSSPFAPGLCIIHTAQVNLGEMGGPGIQPGEGDQHWPGNQKDLRLNPWSTMYDLSILDKSLYFSAPQFPHQKMGFLNPILKTVTRIGDIL